MLWTNSITLNLMVAKSGLLKKVVVAAAEAEVVPVVRLPGPNPVLAPGLDPVLKGVLALLPAGAVPDPEDHVKESLEKSAFQKHFANEKCNKKRSCTATENNQ